jgi:GDPmannose 4,6-dehydratase
VADQAQTRRAALVTGLTGQDGSFLAEQLLDRGYRVTGLVRAGEGEPLGFSEHLRDRVSIVHGDLLAPWTLIAAVDQVQPDELYHLAAPSFTPDSWLAPADTVAAIAGSTATLLEAVRATSPRTRVFVAGSGAMFGAAPGSPQREDTCCRPQTPYATAKLAAHQLTGQIRAHDEVFACSGILYNHESERRPESFVSRKITRAAARAKLGLASELVLGDLNAVRDWSFAGDVVQAVWLVLQSERPDDYVLASGVGRTVAELAEVAFGHVGLDAGTYIRVDPQLVRAPEATRRVGDARRARERLGWEPVLTFEQMIARMVDADIRNLRGGPPDSPPLRCVT